ncbi:MAG: DUF1794 domain-containing protein [Microbacteriaceae bacterium]|nr:DUF1794 domain-containing protein [Microbacteriaceae bacterium]
MFTLPEGLPVELNPLAFLVGTWSGVGVVSSKFVNTEEPIEQKFQQQLTFSVGTMVQKILNYQQSLASGI